MGADAPAGQPAGEQTGPVASAPAPDLADLIAGHYQTSRAHAYEMMQRSLDERDGPAAEPVAWAWDHDENEGAPVRWFSENKAAIHADATNVRPLFTAPQPPRREPLTDSEIVEIARENDGCDMWQFARAIEQDVLAKHGITGGSK